MPQAIQCAVTLHLPRKRVFGTAWRIDGTHLLVTSRGQIPPGSHAQLVWELDGDEPDDVCVIEADAIVRQARRPGEGLAGTHHYSVELKTMSIEHQHALGVWLEATRGSGEADPEQPTDMVLGGLLGVVSEPPTEQVVRPIEVGTGPRRTRPPGESPARVITRQVHLSRATSFLDTAGQRLHLDWLSWADVEADWVSTLSRGTLYLRGITGGVGDAFAIIATLPDGRKALLSGRVSACVRGVCLLEVSMGEQTRGILSQVPRPGGAALAGAPSQVSAS